MSNNLKFDFDKPLPGVTNSDGMASENIIVQCQYCETRYSINRSSISHTAQPKFHCFSCDNVFEIATNTPVVPSPMPQESKVGSFSMNQDLPRSEIKAPNLNFGAAQDSVAANSSFGFSSTLKVTSGSPFQNVKARKEEAKASEKTSFAMNHKSTDFSVRTPEPGVTAKSFVFKDLQGSIGGPLDFKKFQIAPQLKNWKAGLESLSFPSLPSWSAPKVSLPAVNFSKLSRRFSPVTVSWRMLTILSPIILVLFFLYLLTSIILSSPQSFSNYFPFLSSAQKVYPSAGVGVRSLELKLVKLDNGEDLQIFSGEFYNNSSKPIVNPVIEGLFFDQQGEVLARSFYTLDNDISGVKYQSLDRQTLTELPKSSEKARLSVKPQQKQVFTFALAADATLRPRFFSGRVYSIS